MSGKRGPRVCIAPNVYQDNYGRSFKVRVGPWSREQRFPPDYPVELITKAAIQARAELLDLPGAPSGEPAERGTLEGDAERFYKRKRHLASFISIRAEVRAWCRLNREKFGKRKRWTIKKQDVLDARTTWLEKGIAPKTINNRVATLHNLFKELDGKRAPTPCDDIDPLPTYGEAPTVIGRETIVSVYKALLAQEKKGMLRSAKTRARFMVYAASGRRPSEIARALPEDVDLVRRTWRVRDGKGGFTPGGLYLHEDLLVAWQTFVEAKAWGAFREGAFVRVLRNAGWPEGVRPYQLRHSVGLTLSEQGHDFRDVADWLGHRSTETTRENYVPVLGSRMQAMGETLGKRIAWPQDENQRTR